MKKLLICAVLAAAATTLSASNISYFAYVSCGSCVTTYVSWSNEPTPISWVEVDSSSGEFLFSLNVGFPSTTGSIQPDPQTVSGLGSHVLAVVTNGQVGVFTPTVESPSIQPKINVFSKLDLFDAPPGSGGHLIDSTFFVAAPTNVPEPAAWSITAAGLALLLMSLYRRRRLSHT